MPPERVWTLLTYIAAHNNLDQLGMRSWNQIVNVGSSNEVMHGVLYDGPQGAARYIVGDPGLVLQEEPLPDFDSGDPERLLETAQWVFGQYPAQRYGLILWSHGTGWRPEEIREVAQQVRGDDVVGQAEAATRSSRPGSLVLFRSSLAAILRENDLQERAIPKLEQLITDIYALADRLGLAGIEYGQSMRIKEFHTPGCLGKKEADDRCAFGD